MIQSISRQAAIQSPLPDSDYFTDCVYEGSMYCGFIRFGKNNPGCICSKADIFHKGHLPAKD
jgi:hypothetical protein